MPFTIKKDPTKIHILGTGSGWDLHPKGSNAVIYALNDFVKYERYGITPDILFILDVLDEKPQIVSGLDNLGDIISRINKWKVPLVAPFVYEEIPLSQAFPLKRCVEEFGEPYFTNTICYMIAYAIMAGAKEIQLFGVNQAGSHEYNEERGGVEYWIGQALGRGIQVIINGNKSQVMKFKGRTGMNILYGYNQPLEQIVALEEKFGAPIVKRLSGPSQLSTRNLGGQKRLIK